MLLLCTNLSKTSIILITKIQTSEDSQTTLRLLSDFFQTSLRLLSDYPQITNRLHAKTLRLHHRLAMIPSLRFGPRGWNMGLKAEIWAWTQRGGGYGGGAREIIPYVKA